MIEAKELMLGDWLKYGNLDKIVKVTALYGNQVNTNAITPLFLDDLEPIPITPEILEKNGWELFRFGNSYCMQIHIQMAGDGFEMQDITIHRMKVLEVHTSTSTLYMPIKYVHQLQHALKLCGIEKEIKL